MAVQVTDEMVKEFRHCAIADEGGIEAGLQAVLAIVTRQLNAGWLIWSRYHQAWWKADESGYTADMMCAGRYDLAHAQRLACIRKMDDGSPGEVIVRAPQVELIGDRDLVLKMNAAVNAATERATGGEGR